VLPSGRQWRNGLELFHNLELSSPLELLLRARCLTEIEPELVVEALANRPSFTEDGLFWSLNVYCYLFAFTNHWTVTHHTHPFNGPFSGTTWVGRYQKGKTNLDFTEARGSVWQWHQLGRMQVCISLQTDNHASTSPLSFLLAGCPSCRPTNSIKALDS